MESKAGRALARFLSAVVLVLAVLDGALTISCPWWLQVIGQLRAQDVSGIVYGMFAGARGGPQYPLYVAFTAVSGVICLGVLLCAAGILRHILREEPFIRKNARLFRAAGICAFCQTAVFALKMVFSASILTMVCGGAFLLFGLFMLVLSSLFETAARIREENELTI